MKSAFGIEHGEVTKAFAIPKATRADKLAGMVAHEKKVLGHKPPGFARPKKEQASMYRGPLNVGQRKPPTNQVADLGDPFGGPANKPISRRKISPANLPASQRPVTRSIAGENAVSRRSAQRATDRATRRLT